MKFIIDPECIIIYSCDTENNYYVHNSKLIVVVDNYYLIGDIDTTYRRNIKFSENKLSFEHSSMNNIDNEYEMLYHELNIKLSYKHERQKKNSHEELLESLNELFEKNSNINDAFINLFSINQYVEENADINLKSIYVYSGINEIVITIKRYEFVESFVYILK